jgi:transposase InsO family protein
MKELNRRPMSCPHQTPWEIEILILRERRKHKTWGPKKLRAVLISVHKIASPPAVSTIGAILKRNGVPLRKFRNRKALRLPLQGLTSPEEANDVWTVDFKGWFRTLDGERFDPLTVMDLYSRYLLCAKGLAGQTLYSTQYAFRGLFKRYGLPKVIRVDNGVPFASVGIGRISELSAWWTNLGIRVEFIKPASPQENGAHERMHGTMKKECTKPPSTNSGSQQLRMDRWRREYNQDRPHEAIGMQRPAQKYHKSQRRYCGKIMPLRYPRPLESIQVSSSGFIHRGVTSCFIGTAFSGSYLGLKPIDNGIYEVYFAERVLGELHDSTPDRLRPLSRIIPRGSEREQKQDSRVNQSVTHVPG